MRKTPLYLITGFLGSGKTTFLKQMLEECNIDLKIGIIQNEFAPQNIDGTELKQSGKPFKILEINNGSVFCVCLLQDFTKSLCDFVIEEKPDVLFLESSGVSDPVSIAEIMQAPMLIDKVFLAGSFCIVDAVNFEKQKFLFTRTEHQITIADLIVINKIDLVDDIVIERITKLLKNINSLAEIHNSSFCNNIGWDLIESKNARDNNKALFQTNQELRPDIKVGVFKSARKISLKNLHAIIRKYLNSAIRIKGYVLLDNGKSASVQTVFEECNISVLEKPMGNTSLILLGENFNLHEFSKEFRTMVI